MISIDRIVYLTIFSWLKVISRFYVFGKGPPKSVFGLSFVMFGWKDFSLSKRKLLMRMGQAAMLLLYPESIIFLPDHRDSYA